MDPAKDHKIIARAALLLRNAATAYQTLHIRLTRNLNDPGATALTLAREATTLAARIKECEDIAAQLDVVATRIQPTPQYRQWLKRNNSHTQPPASLNLKPSNPG